MSGTGELSYKGNAGAMGGMTGDLNNDGLQDAFFYSATGSPVVFFNRGFRSFGFANSLDYAAALPEADRRTEAMMAAWTVRLFVGMALSSKAT